MRPLDVWTDAELATPVAPPEPSGWRPLWWGLPTGWDAPIYSADLKGWVSHEAHRRYGKLWPAVPAELATAEHLAGCGLRPRNALQPNGFLIGPAYVNGHPASVPRSVQNALIDDHHLLVAASLGIPGKFPCIVDRYPVRALYRRKQALPHDLPPTAAERAEDRWDAAAWAASVLADPDTAILEVGTWGEIDDPIDSPQERAMLCDLAIYSSTGEALLKTLVNPLPGEVLATADLARHHITPKQVRAAPTFREIHATVAAMLQGRQVVCLDRARTYGVLFCELELHAGDGSTCDFNGELLPGHNVMLHRWSHTRFACLRLARSRFTGQWDNRCQPQLAGPVTASARAFERAQAALETLAAMAAAAPSQYRQWCLQAEAAERTSHVQRRTLTVREQRARQARTRKAVLRRSGGWCENPTCTDTGYRQDVTDAGEPLLEVHHTDGDPTAAFARGARDHPSTMLALCRNCHGLVTHGRNRATLNLVFAAAAKEAHQRLLAHEARSGASG
ncbi:hypothetical protein [Nonomuraea sp. NPDC049400]|uniref:hypothetical protein n=1 Tax=Nonomuraea sp. NPDC049400 TaxID=3364352 RepID=UPI0037BDFDCE